MSKEKQYVVLGLGIFGSTIATTLSKGGKEVLAIDRNMACVERIADKVTKAVQADTTDIEQLRALGIEEFDVAIVAIGNQLEASILTVMNLKELGVKYILAKARNKQFMQILEKVGADKVVRPEKDMGTKIVKSLLRNKLEGGYSVVEMEAPSMWVGKTLKLLNVRATYDFNVIGIKKGKEDKIKMSIDPDAVIESQDIFLLVAYTENIERFDLMGR